VAKLRLSQANILLAKLKFLEERLRGARARRRKHHRCTDRLRTLVMPA